LPEIKKISKNYLKLGWQVLVIWESETKCK
jgi:hypothetical protein